MKAFSTLKKSLSRKEGWLSLLIFAIILVFGCYEFRSINQPSQADPNSSFDVSIVMQQDQDESNDFTDEGTAMANHGLLGVLLPEGWTVKDSIVYQVVAADSMLSGDVWKVASKNYSSTGHIVFNQDHADSLTSSTAPDAGYYWWGGRTDTTVDMHFFDSLYFTITIMTDNQTGDFTLRYAVGDEDSDDRMPYDAGAISDPMPITITGGSSTGPSLLDGANIEVFPNPTGGVLHLNIKSLNGEKADLLIYDLRGRTILSKKIDRKDNVFDLSDYKSGTYVLRLQLGEDVMTRKFVLY